MSYVVICLIVTKPPIIQFNARVVSYFWPQGYVAGKPFNYFPYPNDVASPNSALFKEKPYCPSETTLSQDDAQG